MDNLKPLEFLTHIYHSAWQWIANKLFMTGTLIELLTIFVGVLLAMVLARIAKPRLTGFIERRDWSMQTGRFLNAFAHLFTFVAATVFLWIGLAVTRHSGTSSYIINMVASLLTAWVGIRLTTSFVLDSGWARLIAITAWAVAALHILDLLSPTLVLLDSLAMNLGGVRISLLLLIKGVIILAVLLRLAVSTSNLMEKRIKDLDGLTPSAQVLLTKALKITLLATAVVIALSGLGINLSAFAFFGGAIGVGIGFGLQKVVSNLISGVILLLDKSIKPGDVIELGETYGRIQSLGARYVSVVTRDGTEYLIPNEDLITQRVINWSFSNDLVRLKISVGVSYDTDVHEAIRLVVEAARGIPRVLDDPQPICQLKDFGDNSIDLELRIWIADPGNGLANVSSDLRIAIWESFEENNIEIPFPQRDVYIKSQPT
ncbi:mechanosensitive ion channel family protein [Thermodesulfobacteriota bacterium]